MQPETFGIVGYGHFGSFLAHSLQEHGPVLVTDADESRLPEPTDGIRPASLDEIARCDVVVLAVPFGTLEAVVGDLRERLAHDTVVVDVVSTKARATDALQRVLADHPNVVASHPLFGPPSMERIEPGQRLVVTYEKGPRAADLLDFLEHKLGLQVLKRSPEEHDRAMAYMQALPFFIARALIDIGILELADKEDLSIPSFEKLATIAAIEVHHSPEMFDTSQRSNPFAEEARRRLLQALQDLDRRIGDG
ncbi:MAG TPA: prephenate dehydrogenase/arogenate dehydrogenase family protein [Acidimicrobiia bacterium]|nr:prephenate dehydrogenase/arogenate dehydrogenase family protein [Acidimicrobiia bacterium]